MMHLLIFVDYCGSDLLHVLLCEQDNVSALETTNAHAQLVAPLQHAPAAGIAAPRVSQPAADLADLEAVLACANLSEYSCLLAQNGSGSLSQLVLRAAKDL